MKLPKWLLGQALPPGRPWELPTMPAAMAGGRQGARSGPPSLSLDSPLHLT